MLTEGRVIQHVCAHLVAAGYRIIATCGVHDQEVDVEAERDGRTLRIEAKGGTSEKPGTARYGRPFDNGQVLSHVSRAFFAAAKLRDEHPGGDAAIALPDDPAHAARVGQVARACADLGIAVFLVGEGGQVRTLWPVIATPDSGDAELPMSGRGKLPSRHPFRRAVAGADQ